LAENENYSAERPNESSESVYRSAENENGLAERLYELAESENNWAENGDNVMQIEGNVAEGILLRLKRKTKRLAAVLPSAQRGVQTSAPRKGFRKFSKAYLDRRKIPESCGVSP
jgi:hypothetical protein